MVKRQLWVGNATPEQKGSFCSITSDAHYRNVDGVTCQDEIYKAQDRGDEVISMHGTDDLDGSCDIDQRFNLFHSERDGQGSHTPARHRVGGM